MEAIDTWTTEDVVADVEAKFKPTLVARARKREVRTVGTIQGIGGEIKKTVYQVIGDPKLGDAYDKYDIDFDGRRYRCSCQEHSGGEYRTMCSHRLAVILYRKENRVSGGGDAGAHEPEEATTPVTHLPDASPSIPAPTDPVLSGDNDPPLPTWVSSIREHQWPAVEQAIDAFVSGEKVVFMDAPTGSGKTLIGELVRRRLNTRALYVCSTKTLQDQFLEDFPYAKVLKGRSNYPTLDRPDLFEQMDMWGNRALTAADCDKHRTDLPACDNCDDFHAENVMHCSFCHPWYESPYEIAKQEALNAQVAVLNTSYYLTEINNVGMFSQARKPNQAPDLDKPGLIIIDEADLLEGELMSQVEVRITKRQRTKLNINPPSKKTVETSWVEWVNEEALPKVRRQLAKYKDGKLDVSGRREKKRVQALYDKLEVLQKGLGSGNWVYGGYNAEEIVFRPIRVDEFGQDMLWKHSDRFLLMSATLIDPREMVESLGLEIGDE